MIREKKGVFHKIFRSPWRQGLNPHPPWGPCRLSTALGSEQSASHWTIGPLHCVGKQMLCKKHKGKAYGAGANIRNYHKACRHCSFAKKSHSKTIWGMMLHAYILFNAMEFLVRTDLTILLIN